MEEKKLIMPKQTGQLDAFYASLSLFYESRKNNIEWYSNTDFKKNIQIKLPSLSIGAQNGAYLVKQSELTRYFGLAFYDYSTDIGRTKITDRGIRFYNAYLANDKSAQLNILIESILTDSFGRGTTAVKQSDSDIDPPKLFLRAIYDLNGVSRKDLAYLLYVTHDMKINYGDALAELSKVNNFEREIPIEVSNKYSDVKFTVLLSDIGICNFNNENNKYYLSTYTKTYFISKIASLSIYNANPIITYSLEEDIPSINEDDDDDGFDARIIGDRQDQIIRSFAYNTSGEKFINQNNRTPIPYTTKRGNIRFKTNPRIAKTALQICNFTCLCNKAQHLTFESKFGLPYMEAHHLIPMAAQKDFSINIDRVENIVGLCPNCHSAIHLGNNTVRADILKQLFDARKSDLQKIGVNITFDELLNKNYR